MTWAPLDVNLPDDPRIDQVGPYGGWLHVCAWLHSARLLTDGFIPYNMVPRLAAVPSPRKLAVLLVEVGLWQLAPGGYTLDGFLVLNRTREATLREREAGARRQSDWQARRRNGVTNAVSNGVSDAGSNGPDTSNPAVTNGSDSTGTVLEVPPIPPQAGAACDRQLKPHPSCRGCGTNRRHVDKAAKRRGAWCGRCDEQTRMIGVDTDSPSRCQCAQPLRSTG